MVQLYAPALEQVRQESSHFEHNLREKSVKQPIVGQLCTHSPFNRYKIDELIELHEIQSFEDGPLHDKQDG